MTRAVEKYYSVEELALLLSCCAKTILRRIHAREFGDEVVDLAASPAEPASKRRDYRIPASAVNTHLEKRRVFSEPGIAARSQGELRRKARAVSPDAGT